MSPAEKPMPERGTEAVSEHTPVLECRNLCVSYYTRAGEVPAVVDFNLRLMPGEAHGIVGEFWLWQIDRRAGDHELHGQERRDRRRRDPVPGA